MYIYLSISIYLYICICVYIYIYIYICIIHPPSVRRPSPVRRPARSNGRPLDDSRDRLTILACVDISEHMFGTLM